MHITHSLQIWVLAYSHLISYEKFKILREIDLRKFVPQKETHFSDTLVLSRSHVPCSWHAPRRAEHLTLDQEAVTYTGHLGIGLWESSSPPASHLTCRFSACPPTVRGPSQTLLHNRLSAHWLQKEQGQEVLLSPLG